MSKSTPKNLISSLLSASASTLYSLVALGIVAREISANQLIIVISSIGFLLPLGMAQAGISGIVVREIIELRKDGRNISDSEKIRDAFLFCALLSIFILVITLFNAATNDKFYLLPISIFVTLGFICGISQSVAIGESKNLQNSFFQFIALILCSFVLLLTVYLNVNNIEIFIAVIVGPPSLASIIGFLFSCKRFEFRSIFRNFKPSRAMYVYKDVLPFMVSGGLYSLLISASTLNFPEFLVPNFSTDESIFWRLGLTSSNLIVSLGASVLPLFILKLHDYKERNVVLKNKTKIMILYLFLMCLLILAYFIYFLLPVFIDIWISRDVSLSPFRLGWSLIISIWCVVSFLVSGALMTVPTIRVIGCTAISLTIFFLVTALIYPKQPLSLTWAYVAAMVVYALCLVSVIYCEFRVMPRTSRMAKENQN
jgi:O-antigen/teichoic acid export membrane protein